MFQERLILGILASPNQIQLCRWYGLSHLGKRAHQEIQATDLIQRAEIQNTRNMLRKQAAALERVDCGAHLDADPHRHCGYLVRGYALRGNILPHLFTLHENVIGCAQQPSIQQPFECQAPQDIQPGITGGAVLGPQ